jgi:transcriptional regulator with XRE-family HTH domain
MNPHPTFKELFASVRDSLPYKVDGAILAFTEQVDERVKALDLSRTDFASKLNTSPAYITKLMSGGTNFTLESMVKIAEALDSELKVELLPKYSQEIWIEVANRLNPISNTESQVWSLARQRNQTEFMEDPDFVGPPWFGPALATQADLQYEQAA